MPTTLTKPRSLWVLGHRVTLIPAGGKAKLFEATTAPDVPGPPPHHHEDCDEFFYVLEGQLGVMIDDVWTSLAPTEYINIPRGSVHTFRNDGASDIRFLSGYEPSGFEEFFIEFGVDADQPGAYEASIADEAIGRVIEGCAKFGMILAKQPAVQGG